MDQLTTSYNLPSKIAEQLLCSICNLYISCGPVLTSSSNSICGRCSTITVDGTYFRNILFEASMSKFKFPCPYKNQGCKESLLFGENLKHESVCQYRTFVCPSLPYGKCTKSVNAFSIYEHFIKEHKHLILEHKEFKLRLNENSEQNYLMKCNGLIFIVQYKYNKETLLLNTSKFSNQEYRYRLKIMNGLHLHNAVTCDEYPCHPYNYSVTLAKTNSDIFYVNDYLRAIHNPTSIVIRFEIIGNLRDTTSITSWNHLEKYRCQYCYCIAIPPIFKYKSYSCCLECHTQNGYNYEQLILDGEDFPCRWNECSFVGNETNIRDHIDKCEFKTFICHVESCSTNYFLGKYMLDHMSEHGTYCPNPEGVIVNIFENSDKNELYFTIFKNVVITLYCYKRDNKIRIKFQSFEDVEYNVRVCFEHDHCKFRSGMQDYENNSLIIKCFKETFPKCFTLSKHIRAIFSITCK